MKALYTPIGYLEGNIYYMRFEGREYYYSHYVRYRNYEVIGYFQPVSKWWLIEILQIFIWRIKYKNKIY